jgi:glycosyltransferase involved in cell wall biosynthesis
MTGCSIIICTYNPDGDVFKRVLNAVSAIHHKHMSYEIIIIDNNSQPSLKEYSVLSSLIKSIPYLRIVIERVPGLTAARIRGILEASYNWLIFFDDDNEPTDDYLWNLESAIAQYPDVGLWGPGVINVEFINQSKYHWVNNYKAQFQERNYTEVTCSNEKKWQKSYPVGTGLCVKKNIAVEYLKRVQSGVYSLSDRKGRSLSSGGDVQMVLTGIQMGYSVGLHPGIRLNHLILPSKATLAYLLQHAFGTASSNLPAHNELFPLPNSSIYYPSGKDILLKVYYQIKVVGLKNGFRSALIGLSHYLGQVKGVYHLNPTAPPPFIYKILVALLNLE